MQETTSTEFLKWCKVLRDAWNTPSRGDYYLAQIAAKVHQTIAKDPKSIEVTDFLLEFKENKKTDEPPTEEALEARIRNSKAVWGALATNYKVRKPPPKKEPLT